MDPFRVATPKFGFEFIKRTPQPVINFVAADEKASPLNSIIERTPNPTITFVSPRTKPLPVADMVKTFVQVQSFFLQGLSIVAGEAIGVIKPLLPPPAQVVQVATQVVDDLQQRSQQILAAMTQTTNQIIDNVAQTVRQVRIPSGQDILSTVFQPFQTVGTAIHGALPAWEDVASTVATPFRAIKRTINNTVDTVRRVQLPRRERLLAPFEQAKTTIIDNLDTILYPFTLTKQAIDGTVEIVQRIPIPSGEDIRSAAAYSFLAGEKAVNGTMNAVRKIPLPRGQTVLSVAAAPFVALAYPVVKIFTYFRKNAQDERVNETPDLSNDTPDPSNETIGSTSSESVDIDALKEKIRRTEQNFVTEINEYEQQEAALRGYENLINNNYIGHNYSYKDGVDRFLRGIRNHADTSQSQTDQQKHLNDLLQFEIQLKDSHYNDPNAKFDPIIRTCLANLKAQNNSEKDELVAHRAQLREDYKTLTEAGGSLPLVNRAYENLWTKYNPEPNHASPSGFGIHTG